MVKIFRLMLLFTITSALAQQQPPIQKFSLEDFVANVRKNHPVAKQASLISEKARAELLGAKGSFDPLVDFDATKKTFGGKNYYYQSNPEIKIPTRLGGLDIKAGTEENTGDRLLSDVTFGQSSYLGVEMPLAKGLVIDKRRAALKQAKIMIGQSQVEQKKVLNDLLYDAHIAYLQWASSYVICENYNTFIENANKRLRLIKLGYANGEKSVMDTVEASLQLSNYKLQLSDAIIKYLNAQAELSNFLWQENDSPYDLPTNYRPDTTVFMQIKTLHPANEYMALSENENPNLKLYPFKLQSLDIERQLKKQYILPYFNVKANLLSKGYNPTKDLGFSSFEKNYKWGIDFKMPLFLREARGDYKKAQIKIRETNLEFDNKKRQTENKLKYYYNEVTQIGNQLSNINAIFDQNRLLLQNEELKFAQGESSLFMINTRDNKLLETLLKKIELTLKYQKSLYTLYWVTGTLK